MNEQSRRDYRRAAEFLNVNGVEVASLQHEYGIYGGPAGGFILDLIGRLRMPVVTTLHTVLRDPTSDQLAVTSEIARLSAKLVVMSHRAAGFLRDIYHVPEEKIAFVHHGIPDLPFVDPNYYKDQFGVEGRTVAATFGLLSANKGIEHMITAMPEIVKKHPEFIYLVLGVTHPNVKKHDGERYRTSLQRLATSLGVAENVRFLNRFVDIEELCEFLGCADVYVTPYGNEAQITSGTLAYAMGSGKPVVSTPYWYATEMLAEERGVITPFGDAEALSRQRTRPPGRSRTSSCHAQAGLLVHQGRGLEQGRPAVLQRLCASQGTRSTAADAAFPVSGNSPRRRRHCPRSTSRTCGG